MSDGARTGHRMRSDSKHASRIIPMYLLLRRGGFVMVGLATVDNVSRSSLKLS
jgi:cytosine/adenosine deaminase-related metal-dependent hydrolase